MPTALGTVASHHSSTAVIPMTGLVGWWDADDATTFTYTTGNRVAEWRDKSSNGYLATAHDASWAPTRVSGAINGRAAIDVTTVGGGLNTNLTRNLKPVTIIAAVKTGPLAQRGLIGCAYGTTEAGSLQWRANTDGTMVLWAHNTAIVGFSTPGMTADTPVVLGVTYGADNTWAQYRNGAAAGSGTAAATFTGVAMGLGAIRTPDFEPWPGLLAEFVIYDRVLSTVERQQVESYLYDKWLNPTGGRFPGSGLAGWWDAADASTITSSAGQVSAWNDKSGNGKHMAQATAAMRPLTGTATQNGRNVLVFDGTDDRMRAIDVFPPDPGLYTPVTWFVVAKTNVATGQRTPLAADPGRLFLTSGGTVAAYAGSVVDTGIAMGTADARIITLIGDFNGAAATSGVGVDGTFTTGSLGTIFSRTLDVGGIPAGEWWNGTIAEVIVYARALSVAERQQTEQYLREKWFPPPQPPAWGPQDLPGVQTWISAADTASISQTAGAVTQINDLSGNGRHFVGGTNKPTTGTKTMNGRNVLDFVNDPAGTGSLARLTLDAGADILDLDTYTILFVAKLDAVNARMLSLQTTASQAAGNDAGPGSVVVVGGPYAPAPNIQSICEAGFGPYLPIPPGVPARLRVTKQGTTFAVYVNDVVASGTYVSTLDLIRYIHLGSGSTPASPGFSGLLCELVACNTALSSTDLAEWKTYVDYKWYGIGGGGTGGGATFHIPASINDDGTVEVGFAINDWLDTVPNDAVVEFTAGATYWVEETLYCGGRHDMVFEGNGARFEQHTNGDATTPIPGFDHMWPRSRAFWLINGGGNLEFRNFNFYGGNPIGAGGFSPYMGQGYEEQHAFFVNGTQGFKILNNYATQTYGDFVTVIENGRYGEVIGNTGTCLGRQAVAVVHGSDILIQSNTFDHISRSAFDVEPIAATWEVRRVTIDDNDISFFVNVFIANLGAGGNCSDITVTNNRLSGDRTMITVSAEDRETGSPTRRSNYRIINNTSSAVDGSPIPFMRFYDIDGITIEDNYQRLVGTYSDPTIYSGKWISVQDCTDVTVRNNIAQEDSNITSGVILLSGNSAAAAVHCGNITAVGGVGPPVDGVCP